jgi:hypothetical protein
MLKEIKRLNEPWSYSIDHHDPDDPEYTLIWTAHRDNAKFHDHYDYRSLKRNHQSFISSRTLLKTQLKTRRRRQK